MPHAVEKSVPLRRYPANAALGKAVTASAASTAAPLSAATDNVTTATPVVDLGTGVQWIQVDLGGSYDLSRITVSHYWGDGRTYHDVIVRVSTDGVRFTTVFNNDADGSAGMGVGADAEYAELSTGKQVALPTPICARYVRFYTNGNSVNPYNHYSELQAFGTGVPSGCPVNVALGTTPTASVASGAASLSTATDNVMTATPVVDLGTGVQWIQLDLGGSYDLTRFGMSHYWGDGRTYHDVIVRASADTTSFATVYNNDVDGSSGLGFGADAEYPETASGKTIVLPTPLCARYVRFYTNGNSVNAYNHYTEIEAFGSAAAGGCQTNVASGKTVTASVASTGAPLSAATDGVTTATPVVDLGTGVQWLQVDLGSQYDLSRVTVSHYWGDGRTYHDVIVRGSTDGTNFTTVFNNDTDGSTGLGAGTDAEFVEPRDGKPIVFPAPQCTRYLRFYSNGNNVNAYNHYSEIRAFGVSAAASCPTGGGPVVSTAPHNATNQNPGLCIADCGATVLTHTIPSYTSMDVERSLTLFYGDFQASPTMSITLDVRDTSTTRTASVMSLTVLDSAGVIVNSERFFSYSQGNWRRLGARFAVANRQTGSHNFTAVVTSHYTNSSTSVTSVPLRVLVLNEASNPLGAGWTLAGVQRLVRQGDGMVVTDGAGAIQWYGGVCATAPCTYTRPPGEFAELKHHTGWVDGSTYDWRTLDGQVTAFDSSGYALNTQDRFGNRTTFTYDANYRITAITDPVSKVTSITAGVSTLGGPKLTITDPAGRVTTLNHNALNDVKELKDPVGATVLAADYGATLHRVSGWTDRRSGLWTVDYDCALHTNGIRTPTVTVNGSAVRPRLYVNHSDVASTACSTAVDGSSNGLGTSISTPATSVSPDSIRARTTDARGFSTKFAVDVFGAPTRIEDPLGRATTIERDNDSRVTRIKTPSGHVLKNSYSGQDVTMSDSTTGRTITYEFDTRYHVPKKVSGHTVTVQHFLDTFGSRIDSTSVGGAPATKFAYNSQGRPTQVTDPAGNVTQIQLATSSWQNTDYVQAPGGQRTSYAYDGAGRPRKVTNALGDSTITVYDSLNRTRFAVGPRADTTRFTYDSLYLWKVTDAKAQVWRYDRNALGWIETLVDAAGYSETFAYDSAGNVLTQVNRRSQTTSNTYDAIGRPLTLNTNATDASRTTTFSYDASDRWMAAVNGYSRDTVKFDVAGRTISEAAEHNGITTAVTTTYDDPYPERKGVSWASAHTVQYGYDTTRKLIVITAPNGDSTRLSGYTPDRLVDTTAYPTSVARHFGYSSTRGRLLTSYTADTRVDSLYQLSMHADSLGRVTQRYRFPLGGSDTTRFYTYDAAGQLSSYTDKVLGGKSCSWSVDRGRVCTVTSSTTVGSASYSYDLVGTLNDGGTIDAGDRLRSYQGHFLSYDLDGNLTQKIVSGGGTYAYAWNALGELTSVMLGTDTVARYTYDGFGRRVMKRTATDTAWSQWDAEHVVAERSSSGAITVEYGYFPGMDNPHSATASGNVYYAATERPGNVIGMFVQANALTAVYRYSPFGVLERNDSLSPNGLRFHGRPWDDEAKLYYFRARYYDPQLGRFVSEDPIGLEGGINPYAYAGNDPVNRRDPSGLSQRCDSYYSGETWTEVNGFQWVSSPGRWTTVCYDDGNGGRSGLPGDENSRGGGGGGPSSKPPVRVPDRGEQAVRTCRNAVLMTTGSLAMDIGGAKQLATGARSIYRFSKNLLFNQSFHYPIPSAIMQGNLRALSKMGDSFVGTTFVNGPSSVAAGVGLSFASEAIQGVEHDAWSYIPLPFVGTIVGGLNTYQACFNPQ